MAQTVPVKTRTCGICHTSSIVYLTMTEFDALNSPTLIQDALPQRDRAFRELILTGTHPECWNKVFGSISEQVGADANE